jgi:hypothetical protein
VGVPQVMKPNSPKTGQRHSPSEGIAERTRADGAAILGGEHEIVCPEGWRRRLRRSAPSVKYLRRPHVQGNEPSASLRLQRRDLPFMIDLDDALNDLQLAGLQVYVTPAQSQQLAAAQPSRGGQMEGVVVRVCPCRRKNCANSSGDQTAATGERAARDDGGSAAAAGLAARIPTRTASENALLRSACTYLTVRGESPPT